MKQCLKQHGCGKFWQTSVDEVAQTTCTYGRKSVVQITSMLKYRCAQRLLRINTSCASVATTLISATLDAFHIAKLSNREWATERNEIQFLYRTDSLGKFLVSCNQLLWFSLSIKDSKMSHPRCVYINNRCRCQSVTHQYLKRCLIKNTNNYMYMFRPITAIIRFSFESR